jgi:hypothetical protein
VQGDIARNYIAGLLLVAVVRFMRVWIIRRFRITWFVTDSEYRIDRAESEYTGNQRDNTQPAKVPKVHQFQWQDLRLWSVPGSGYHDDANENTEYLAKYIQVTHQNYVMQRQWLLVTCQAISLNKCNSNIFMRCRP